MAQPIYLAPLSARLDLLRTAVSKSQTFCDRGGGLIQFDALKRIHLDYKETDDEIYGMYRQLPICVITEEEDGFELIAQDSHHPRGTIKLQLSDNSDKKVHDEAKLDFVEFASGVITDIVNDSGVSANFDLIRVSLAEKATRTSRELRQANYDFWTTAYSVSYGLT